MLGDHVEEMRTVWLHRFQPNNGILVFPWLPTCSLLPRFGCIQVSEQDLGHFLLHPPTLCFFLPLFLCLLPSGRERILSRTKETVAVAENEQRQLDSRGLEIVLHLFTCNTVCTPFSLCPHSFLSPSPHPLQCLLTLSPSSTSSCAPGFSSHYYFRLSLRALAVAHSISYATSPLLLSPSRSAVSFFLFVSVCSHSAMWSEPLQWIISQLTHRGQPKPPVQT